MWWSPASCCHRFPLPIISHLPNTKLNKASFLKPKPHFSSRFQLQFQLQFHSKHITPQSQCRRRQIPLLNCTTSSSTELQQQDQNQDDEDEPSSSSSSSSNVECVGTGLDVECLVEEEEDQVESEADSPWWEWAVVVSPFFFWGTAMVAMKEVIPKAGPFAVAAFRLVPAGLLLVAFAASRRRPFPSGARAWLSISLFALVDAACFQGFLAVGLQKTSAGLGSVCFVFCSMNICLFCCV